MKYNTIATAVFTSADRTESVRVSATLNEHNVFAFLWAFGSGIRVTAFLTDRDKLTSVNLFAASFVGAEVLPQLESFVNIQLANQP